MCTSQFARLGRSLCRHQIHAAATETHVFWWVKISINTEPWHCEDERCRASSEKVCSMFIKKQTFLCTTSTCIFLNYFFPFIDDILNIPSHSTIRCGPLKQRTDVKGVVFNFKENDCDRRVCNISSEDTFRSLISISFANSRSKMDKVALFSVELSLIIYTMIGMISFYKLPKLDFQLMKVF